MTLISSVTASPLAAAVATASLSSSLLECLTPDQRASFLRFWERLPSHLRTVALDLQAPDWTPLAIEQLDDTIRNVAGVIAKSKAIFGSCSPIPFEIWVPEGNAPVTSRSHRINPISAKEVDAP